MCKLGRGSGANDRGIALDDIYFGGLCPRPAPFPAPRPAFGCVVGVRNQSGSLAHWSGVRIACICFTAAT